MQRQLIFGAGLMLASMTPLLAGTHKVRHAATVHVIVINQMQYGPMPADIHAGDVLEWVNKDMFEHSATARDGSFDVDLPAGASKRIVARSGTVTFFCKFHPGMSATLVVK